MTNVYHIAGLDDRERGFNRQAQVIAQGAAYQARLRYEALQIEVESVETEEEALQRLIHVLQERGYFPDWHIHRCSLSRCGASSRAMENRTHTDADYQCNGSLIERY